MNTGVGDEECCGLEVEHLWVSASFWEGMEAVGTVKYELSPLLPSSQTKSDLLLNLEVTGVESKQDAELGLCGIVVDTGVELYFGSSDFEHLVKYSAGRAEASLLWLWVGICVCLLGTNCCLLLATC